MNIVEFFTAAMSNQDTLIRFSLLILIALYGLFALIIAIQISNLNKVVNQIGFSVVFNALAFAHLLGALALLIFSVVFL